MAGEVVDLISSSPEAEAKPRSHSRYATTNAKASTSTRPSLPAAVDLNGFADEFDATGDIDNTAPRSQRFENTGDSSSRQTGIPGVELWSDDFQSTGDLAEPILSESTGNGNKRRRISPSPRLSSSPRRALKGKASVVDNTDYSDPFASSPPPPTADIISSRSKWQQEPKASGLRSTHTCPSGEGPSKATQDSSTRAAPKAKPTTPTIPQSSDPFASSQDEVDRILADNAGTAAAGNGMISSPRPVLPASKSRFAVAREVSSDPFASSPARKPTLAGTGVMDLTLDDDGSNDENAPRQLSSKNNVKPQGSPNRVASSDPFASSPQQPKQPIATKHGPNVTSSPPLGATSFHARRQQWDPISSSAPETGVVNIDSDSDSANDSEDLPDLESIIRNPTQRSRSQLSRSRSDVLPSARTTGKTANAKQPARTSDERARDKARKDADKAREKERKKEERLRTKEAKTREKERAAALAEVNKMRTDKKVSTKEMIIDVPSSLNDGTKVQLDTLLEGLGVDFRTWDTSDVVFKWRRKVTSKWNEDLGHWEPIPHRVMHEKHVAVVMTAQEFVDLALDTDRGIRSHIVSMEEKFSGNQIIYIIEGMDPWMRKNRNLRNRQFTSGVRSETTSTGRRRAAPQQYVDQDLIEDALLELQVMHDVLIHHTTIPLETAQWITVLTQHISTIPYKVQKSEAQGAGFCMESGQVKTGEDNKDTYVRLLQEIARVTQPIAYGVSIEFPSVTQLVNGLSEGGAMRLSEVKKTVNKEGTLGDRAIGQAVSKRIHKVFTGRDEKSTDV